MPFSVASNVSDGVRCSIEGGDQSNIKKSSSVINILMNYWKRRSKLEKILYLAIIILIVIIICLIITISIVSVQKFKLSPESSTCQTDICKRRGENLKLWIDRSIDPCDDFYKHCCGGWLRENPLPDSTALYSTSSKLEVKISEDIRKLLAEKANAKRFPRSINQMLTFYKACLDADSVEEGGTEPLANFLKELGGWPLLSNDWDRETYDWVEVISKLVRRTATGYIIRFIISPDPRNTSNRIIQLDRPTLMIDTNDLLNTTSSTNNLDKYKKRIKSIALFLNAPNDTLDDEIEGIIDFERNLAKMLVLSSQQEENRYNKATILEFQKKLPKFQLLRYLQLVTNESLDRIEETVSNEESIIIRDIEYLQNLTEFIQDQPDVKRQIANYLGWRVIEKYSAHLPADLVKILTPDANSSSERWKYCVSLTKVAMGYAVAHAYITENEWMRNYKDDVEDMVEKQKTIFNGMIQDAKWMDSKTKEEAIRKIEAMKDRVGYPDWVKDKESVDKFYEMMGDMGKDPFLNDLTVAEYTSTKLIISLRQSDAFPEWSIDPLTVNAGYDQNENSITVPIAILQEPFYDCGLPRYLNYATIGAVIGHEITHGFDNKGSERDADGNIINWWTDKSKQEFNKRADCFVQQYNSYGVNGEKTLAENIADNGGLKQAYLGYKKWQSEDDSSSKLLPGFENYTTDQLFFLSYCTLWCTQYSTFGWNVSLTSLHHSPSTYRVWGTLSNMDEFSEAFQCTSSKMNRSGRKCAIW